jgi:hypothetical protein
MARRYEIDLKHDESIKKLDEFNFLKTQPQILPV